jgi:hypothetical protein
MIPMSFFWWDTGLLGERIPLIVENISLRNLDGVCGTCPFDRTDPNRIAFIRGNYSIGFDGSIHNNHFITEYDEPTTVQVHLPQGLDVRNPFLGSVSRGGEVTVSTDSSINLQWTDMRLVEFRFYDIIDISNPLVPILREVQFPDLGAGSDERDIIAVVLAIVNDNSVEPNKVYCWKSHRKLSGTSAVEKKPIWGPML